jgi:hypothetical protein
LKFISLIPKIAFSVAFVLPAISLQAQQTDEPATPPAQQPAPADQSKPTAGQAKAAAKQAADAAKQAHDAANQAKSAANKAKSAAKTSKTPEDKAAAQQATAAAKQASDAAKQAAAAAKQVDPSTKCTEDSYCDDDLHDLSGVFQAVGGYEQAWSSSQAGSSNAFIKVYGRHMFNADNSELEGGLGIWYSVRLLSAPQASDTYNVTSVFTNPSGQLKSQTFPSVGSAVDFDLGGQFHIQDINKGQTSFFFIGGGGATTPAQANTLIEAFKVPDYGTVECSTLRTRFMSQFASDNIGITGTKDCLDNNNSKTPVNVTTLAFSNQDRSNFFGKYYAGFRVLDRFPSKDPTTTPACTPDAKDSSGNSTGNPCARGIVDFTLGQDSSVTGGFFRHVLFKLDAIHPMPIKNLEYLYLFGSISIRFAKNVNYSPLILTSIPASSLTGTGASALPNPSAVVLPLRQPDRDFYRIGAGISINQIFTALANK